MPGDGWSPETSGGPNDRPTVFAPLEQGRNLALASCDDKAAPGWWPGRLLNCKRNVARHWEIAPDGPRVRECQTRRKS